MTIVTMDKIARLRQKIKELRKLLEDHNYYLDNSEQAVGYANALLDIENFLDTLSEEPDKGLDVTDFCKPIDPGIAQCVADHWWEMLGEDEKPVPNDLEEAALGNYYSGGYIPKNQELREVALKTKEAQSFIAGAEWHKNQMLKDAVEGYVNYYEDSGGILMTEAQVGCPYHNGDKVRIVVLKEEDE